MKCHDMKGFSSTDGYSSNFASYLDPSTCLPSTYMTSAYRVDTVDDYKRCLCNIYSGSEDCPCINCELDIILEPRTYSDNYKENINWKPDH